MTTKYLTASALVTALGWGRSQTLRALEEERSGLRPLTEGGLTLHAGRIPGIDDTALPSGYAPYECRNNRLAEATLATDDFAAAVDEAVARYGADRVGIFLATSTGGMCETEASYRDRSPDGVLPADFTLDTTHRLSATTQYLRLRCGIRGVTQSVSTACSSSAKVLASAARHMDAGLCDAAIVGGVDTLCRTTLFGFHALELTSRGVCRPFSGDRDGLCLGEAGALTLLEPGVPGEDQVALLGYGESTDAYHMATPHPQGLGARLALRQALESAGLRPNDLDYINLHGTATPLNDQVEDYAVAGEVGTTVPASSTKGWTGHTLGAAGMVEAVITGLILEEGMIPATLNTRELDPEVRCDVQLAPSHQPVRRALSNSFGFGGNNCVLALGYT